jgi:hypothetical protein
MPIQIILFIIALAGLYAVVRRYQKEELTSVGLGIWSVLWIVVAIVAVLPNSTAAVAKFVGVGRGADVVVYGSLVVIFFILFRLTINLEKIRRDTTEVVRAMALQKMDQEVEEVEVLEMDIEADHQNLGNAA